MAAVGLAALWRQVSEGGGAVHVEGSMFEAAVGYIEEHALLASAGCGPVARNGNRHPSQAPHECFPCKGEDEWIAISVADDEAWAALLRVAGPNAALDRDEWQTAAGRLADVDALESAVGEWTQLWDAQTLQARLQRAGVAAGVVHSTLSHLTDPQLEARGWWRFLEHPRHRCASLRRLPLALLAHPRVDHPTGAAARRAHRRDPDRTARPQRG